MNRWWSETVPLPNQTNKASTQRIEPKIVLAQPLADGTSIPSSSVTQTHHYIRMIHDEWDPSVSYHLNDAIMFQKELYICIVNETGITRQIPALSIDWMKITHQTAIQAITVEMKRLNELIHELVKDNETTACNCDTSYNELTKKYDTWRSRITTLEQQQQQQQAPTQTKRFLFHVGTEDKSFDWALTNRDSHHIITFTLIVTTLVPTKPSKSKQRVENYEINHVSYHANEIKTQMYRYQMIMNNVITDIILMDDKSQEEVPKVAITEGSPSWYIGALPAMKRTTIFQNWMTLFYCPDQERLTGFIHPRDELIQLQCHMSQQ